MKDFKKKKKKKKPNGAGCMHAVITRYADIGIGVT